MTPQPFIAGNPPVARDDISLNVMPPGGADYAAALRAAARGGEHVAPYALSVGIVSECGESRCGYCSNWRSSSHREMSLESLVAIFDDAVRLGVTQVLFSGGEPLFHSRWFEVMQEAKGRGLDVLLITNGLLLDEGALDTLRVIGCKKLGISCDSLDDARYRRIRGTER